MSHTDLSHTSVRKNYGAFVYVDLMCQIITFCAGDSPGQSCLIDRSRAMTTLSDKDVGWLCSELSGAVIEFPLFALTSIFFLDSLLYNSFDSLPAWNM